MVPQASKKYRLVPPDYNRIGSYMSNGINSEKVSGTFSVLTMSSLSPQASAQSEKRFLRALSCFRISWVTRDKESSRMAHRVSTINRFLLSSQKQIVSDSSISVSHVMLHDTLSRSHQSFESSTQLLVRTLSRRSFLKISLGTIVGLHFAIMGTRSRYGAAY